MKEDLKKKLFDMVLAFILALLAFPLLLVITCLIMTYMGTPIIFKQKRPGKDEKIFTIYKFRTMTNNRDCNGNMFQDKVRLTKFGKYLRSTSLDELPQLINILKGNMSFVGPRALLIEYLPLYNNYQRKRHSIKPGITGWAQINGRNNISWSKKFKYDIWYVNNQSFQLDIKIIFMSIIKVVKRSNISSKGNVTVSKFKGTNEK